MFGFEKLEVWQRAIEFADVVYATTRDFPVDGRFGLTNQMRRAAVSISSNIAEGRARNSHKDFARCIEIAAGSLYEVISQSYMGRNQGFLSPEKFDVLYAAADEQSRVLSDLRRSPIGES